MMEYDRKDPRARLLLLPLMWVFMTGCAMTTEKTDTRKQFPQYEPDTIIEAASGRQISFEELLADLSAVRVIYVGERHTQPHHHGVQVKVMTALADLTPDLSVGMEMFDRTYQPVLDQWTSGTLTREAFLRQTHWYANWRYDFSLYEDILNQIRARGLRLFGLNIPFHIPPKIAVGGIDSLNEAERIHLPEKIDMGNPAHRQYVRSVFDAHHAKGRDNFEFFYNAQCVWEDVMAETIARHLSGNTMVVLAGNGHILRKFGIPDRAFDRTGAPFRTLYLVDPGEPFELSWGDYIWVTPASEDRSRGMHGG